MNQRSTDERWMRLALTLARRGLGRVWPNPAVGCVLVQGNRVVGRGWTQPGGRPHAETVALAQAGPCAKGATAYVSLEPCAHHGKTPPCAQALIDAKVARVVCALTDPDIRVSGKGFKMLETAGIAVTTRVLNAEATSLNLGFLTKITKSRPMVTLKLAASLDGRIATRTGDSRWITGPASRRFVHLMRASHDAIMIGSGTALADDPDLSVRGLGMAPWSPVRVVLDSKLRLPATSQLARTAANIPVWLCHDKNATASDADLPEVRLIGCKTDSTGRVDPTDALAQLAKSGITRVLCEGGGQLAASLLRQHLVDRLIVFSAGLAIGSDAKPMLATMGLDQLASAPRFDLLQSVILGNDVMTSWKVT